MMNSSPLDWLAGAVSVVVLGALTVLVLARTTLVTLQSIRALLRHAAPERVAPPELTETAAQAVVRPDTPVPAPAPPSAPRQIAVTVAEGPAPAADTPAEPADPDASSGTWAAVVNGRYSAPSAPAFLPAPLSPQALDARPEHGEPEWTVESLADYIRLRLLLRQASAKSITETVEVWTYIPRRLWDDPALHERLRANRIHFARQSASPDRVYTVARFVEAQV
jgi:hypothetical protein